MTVHALEPQPLAFRVRPQADECFDSWIDRVAAAHETTRPALFRHLGLETALASMDLARGTCGLANEQYFAVYQMIGQLAWAVQIEPQQIEGTFLNVEASAVLPRLERRYVCSRCWQQASQDGRAPIIRKEWILRMSWRCQVHDLPLCRLPVADGAMSKRAVGSWLSGTLARAESLRWGLELRPRLVEWNAEGVARLVRASRKRFKGEKQAYVDRFQANLFHFAHDRIAMLALAHSRVGKATWGFERLVALKLPERPGREVMTLKPPKLPPRRWRIGKRRLPSASYNVGALDIVLAYAHLRVRRDAQTQVEAQFGRFASRGEQSGPGLVAK